MIDVIAKEQLEHGTLFQGGMYGNLPFSFFWVEVTPGQGSKLHMHPYDEIFVLQEGQAIFTLGDVVVKVEEGHIVIGPAEIPHKFFNSGSGPLRMVNIHPSQQIIQQRLEM
jgi:mannose-6-phosphate isomerase-like protein (cupin superfamily)